MRPYAASLSPLAARAQPGKPPERLDKVPSVNPESARWRVLAVVSYAITWAPSEWWATTVSKFGDGNLSVHLLTAGDEKSAEHEPGDDLSRVAARQTKRPIRRIPDRSGVAVMRMISGRIRKVLGFLAACVVAVPVLAEEAYCPARVQLKPIVKIGWRLGPDYPMGIQDSAFGFLRGQMVSAGGFTRHPLDIVTHYSDAFGGEASGFTKLAFALDPGQEDHGWRRVADIPGPARQGGAVAVVADAMYVMGGISYAEPYTYRDTYQLQGRDGTWAWRKLESCQLPWPVYGAAGSAAVIGSKIYLLGVADYFRGPVQRAPTSTRKPDGMAPRSARLCWFWIRKNLESGWKRLADCPGLPQFDAGVAAAAGKIWRLGGIYAPLHKQADSWLGQYAYYNAVDSWMYDPVTNQWSRLPDMPDGSNRRALTYLDRYVILVAGYKYPVTWHLDGAHGLRHTRRKKRDGIGGSSSKTPCWSTTRTAANSELPTLCLSGLRIRVQSSWAIPSIVWVARGGRVCGIRRRCRLGRLNGSLNRTISLILVTFWLCRR